MTVYLVQHAEAKREEEDPERDLTEKGRMDIDSMAQHLKRLKVQVRQIIHSGRTRAHSTAKVLAQHLNPSNGVSEADGLAPLDDPLIWSERLAKTDGDVILVGHLPHLAGLASILLTGNKDKNLINFQMGSIVRLQKMAAEQWAVDWMVVPEIIL